MDPDRVARVEEGDPQPHQTRWIQDQLNRHPVPSGLAPRELQLLGQRNSLAFRETGNVRIACELAKVGRNSHYRWLKEDPEYREAFDLAKECAALDFDVDQYRGPLPYDSDGIVDREITKRLNTSRCLGACLRPAVSWPLTPNVSPFPATMERA